MSFNREPLFSIGWLDAAIDKHEKDLINEVNNIESGKLVKYTIEEWQQHFIDKFKINAPRIKDKYIEQKDADIDISRDPRYVGYGEPKPVYKKGTVFLVHLPFEGDQILFRFKPSEFQSTVPHAQLRAEEVILIYQLTDPDEKTLGIEIKKDIDQINKYLKWVENDVAKFNSRISEIVKKRIEERLRVKQRDDAVMESVIASIGLSKKPKVSANRVGPPEMGTNNHIRENSDMATKNAEVDISNKAIRYIAIADLWHYSQLSRKINEVLGSEGVTALDAKIKKFINDAAEETGQVSKVISEVKGDCGILIFDDADSASKFGEKLHLLTKGHNKTQQEQLQLRYFRVGIAKGEINLEEASSIAYTFAKRLESRCKGGEILICDKTYFDLSEEERSLYGGKENVPGKEHDDAIEAHRRRVIDPPPGDSSSTKLFPFSKEEFHHFQESMRWGGKWDRFNEGNHATLGIWDVTPESFQFEILAIHGANDGEIKGTAIINKGKAKFNDKKTSCEVNFSLKSNIIEIQTNESCLHFGGLGVCFSGKYQRTKISAFFEDEGRGYAFKRMVNDYYDQFLESKHLFLDKNDVDGFGAIVRSFGVRGLSTVKESIIMMNQEGKVWAAVIDGKDVRYFTNDADYKCKLPKTIDMWRQAFSDKRLIFPEQE